VTILPSKEKCSISHLDKHSPFTRSVSILIDASFGVIAVTHHAVIRCCSAASSSKAACHPPK
jgi:hypothetical protein